MRNWIAAIGAALIVLAAGTALASVPSGNSTSFNVGDRAVGVLASGQVSTAKGVSPNCTYKAEATTYCFNEELSFTPHANGVCQVSADLGFTGTPMGEKGSIDGITYGIADRVEGKDVRVDENGIGVSPTFQGYATMPRSRLVAVEAGKEYTFEPWLNSSGASHGTLYWDMDYVCFG